MTSVDVELGLTALAAMLSPTTLTFSVLPLVLGERPGRTGLWFFLGAFGLTLIIGVIAAFALGSAAASPGKSAEPNTWVSIVDIIAGVSLLAYVIRTLRRPRDPKRLADAIQRMSKVSSSPAIAIVAAGATLANPGRLHPPSPEGHLAAEAKHERVHRTLVGLRSHIAAATPGRSAGSPRRTRLDRRDASNST